MSVPYRWTRRHFLRGSATTLSLAASPWRGLALPAPMHGPESPEVTPPTPVSGAAAVTLPLPAQRPIPLLRSTVARPLRYTLHEGGYHIRNGRERFNRPLYGTGGADMLLEAGDLPEFRLALPTGTAHLRMALVRGTAAPRPLTTLDEVTAHLQAGRLRYTLRDPDLLGQHGELTLEALSAGDTPGMHLVVSGHSLPGDLELLCALRVDARPRAQSRASTEELLPNVSRDPHPYDPADCAGVSYKLFDTSATASSPAGDLAVTAPPGSTLHLVSAAAWDSDWNSIAFPPAATPTGPHLLVLRTLAPAAGALTPQHLELRLTPPSAVEKNPRSSAVQTASARPPSEPSTPAARLTSRRAELAALSTRVRIRTPEPWLDAAVIQLNLAADALWSTPAQSLVAASGEHIASPGWSAPPGLDALGLHERVRQHLQHWAAVQITTPLPPGIEPDGPVAAPPDPGTALTRKSALLNTNGAFGAADRDTSLWLLESIVRHLRWTGDLALARALWPTFLRGMDRQYRLFRREFPDPEAGLLHQPAASTPALALYESYGSLSAADTIAGNGAGAAHATARNLFLNRGAAVLARVLGEDAVAFDAEATLLDRSLRRLLWQPSSGSFAESRDSLFPQTLTGDPGLWTASRLLDSECVTPREAWQIAAERLAAHVAIPVCGPGLPEPNLTALEHNSPITHLVNPAPKDPRPSASSAVSLSLSSPPTPFLLASSTWHGPPNPISPGAGVASLSLAENARMALALWSAGDPETALALLNGCVIDSTARGLVPGNLHGTSALDPLTGETGIDHADSIAALARAVIEGLFGIQPDLLRAGLTVRPGFPAAWTEAELHHPEIDLVWTRDGLSERFTITSRLPQPVTLTLLLPARGTADPVVLSSGQSFPAHFDSNSTGAPRLIVSDVPPATTWQIEVRWRGKPPVPIPARATLLAGESVPLPRGLERSEPRNDLDDPQMCLHQGVAAAPGHHAVFARVVSGNCGYWLPIPLTIVPISVTTSAMTPDLTESTEMPRVRTPGAGSPPSIASPEKTLSPLITADGERFEPLLPNALCDGYITEIATRAYRAPRSTLCSLALPEHLLGDSFAPAPPLAVSDHGLRTAGGTLRTASGIPFATPSAENIPNCRYLSFWSGDRDATELSLSGRASAVHLLLAAIVPPGAVTSPVGHVHVHYSDGSATHLALRAANGLWPVDRDLFLDDFVFPAHAISAPVHRVDLATGRTRILDTASFAGGGQAVPGGSASVLHLPLSPDHDLTALRIEASRYGVVLALLGVTLARSA